jgi:hypothetical protein
MNQNQFNMLKVNTMQVNTIKNTAIKIISDKITLSTSDSSTILEFTNDGLNINKPKSDYLKWIPFSIFTPSNSTWNVQRKLSGSNPLYCLTKNNSSETSWLHSTFNCSFRKTLNKGKRIKNIYVGYEIETQNITSISAKLTVVQFNNPSPTPVLSNIPINESELNTGILVGEHYKKIEIVTPQFINAQAFVSFEIEITTPINSIFNFYGIHLEFDYNCF